MQLQSILDKLVNKTSKSVRRVGCGRESAASLERGRDMKLILGVTSPRDRGIYGRPEGNGRAKLFLREKEKRDEADVVCTSASGSPFSFSLRLSDTRESYSRNFDRTRSLTPLESCLSRYFISVLLKAHFEYPHKRLGNKFP